MAAAALFARTLAAQAPADSLPRPLQRFPGDTIVVRPVPEVEPGGLYGLRVPPALVALRWARGIERSVAAARSRRRRDRVLALSRAAVLPDTLAAAEPAPEGPPAREAPSTFEALGRYADVGLELRSRLELKMDRLKNEHCTAFDISSLTPGCRSTFPTPAIGQQFSVRAGGIVSQRVHVNVDYDTEREFNANNNINVFYQGLEDEILRRVDIGNVTFEAPRSRFITASIPANSFGIQALGQVGPLEFRTIFAQQRGSSLRTRVFTMGDQATQPIDRENRDLDFEAGRFFFVVNPRDLPGYPAVDILRLAPDQLPAADRLAAVRIYRLRAQSGQSGSNANLGGIDAVAIRRDSPQRVGPFSWERLVEGRDYYLDPSGVWFALVTRVSTEDFLAVSYVTVSGDTVGTFPAINTGADTLELIYEPRRGTEVPTFAYEMRNVYRIGGGNLSRSSIELAIVLNESERPIDGEGTYLSRLGLARSNDASSLDEFNRVFPRERDPNSGAPLKDLFVVFPHLVPFADSARLTPEERNDSLYRTPIHLLSSQGPPPKFRLRVHYEATGAGDRSTLSLGALQVREGSERLYLGTRELVRGRDYQVAYDVGVVTFLNPDSLFQGTVQIRAQFEENQQFDEAPKNNFGLSGTYHLGSVGTVSAIGLYQSEQTAFTRPPLGFEPRSGLIGGLSTDLGVRGSGLTRALDALPGLRTAVPSSFTLRGEIDVSRPNPNQRGQAYIDEFEGLAAVPLRLVQNTFQLGSRPSSGRGLSPLFLGADGNLSPFDAATMIWQNAIQAGSVALEFEPQQIDSSIVIAGASRQVETVLWLTMKHDTIGGAPDPVTGRARWIRPHTPGPRWRSITQSLDRSGLGVDLSRTEFLEFWVLEDADRTAQQQQATLLFDFGTVFEDATSPAPDTFRVVGKDTVFSGLQFTGAGRLDTEKDSLTNVFNAAISDVGVHGDLIDSIVDAGSGTVVHDVSTCQLPSGGVPAFPLGDLAADCTRRNGFADSEDLDGDNRLDSNVGIAREDLLRYVFPLGDERYHVKDGGKIPDQGGRFLTWRLYRIPFRTDTLQVGTPNVHQVRALRITLAAPNRGSDEREFFFALARVRLVGAPWVKRAGTPLAGIAGSRAELHGEVVASIISTENKDLGYTSPPGVTNQTQQVGGALQFGSQQINEQSLRLLARDLRTGERAEAFVRFADEADKNFLKYRNLRVWARGRGPGWEDGDLEFYIKVGKDENNFYFYHLPARTDRWEPEVVIDLDRWKALRATVQSAWLRGDPPSGAAQCGGDSTAYVACDGAYLVQVRDPGVSPPNLARVSEVAVGMLRRAQSVAIDQAELWVDDIRLSGVVGDAGVAAAIDARLAAADFAELNLSLSNKDAKFRQLGEEPNYVGNGAASFASTFQLAKLAPERWGLSVPLTIQHLRTRDDPFYVSRSDIRTDAIVGLRRPRGSATTYQVAVRRAKRGATLWERMLLDPVSVAAMRRDADATAELSTARTVNRQASVGYLNPAGARTLALPGFLSRMVDALPRVVRESEFGRSLRTARLRWNPYQLRYSSLLTDSRIDRSTFRVPVTLPGDSAIVPLSSLVHTWRNDAGIDLRPFNTLAFRVDYSRIQDLQHYGDSTSLGRVLDEERTSFLGRDVGFERTRLLNTVVNISPVIGSWLRPRASFTSSFAFNRDPSGRTPIRLGQDSSGAFAAPHSLGNSRRRDYGATVDLSALIRGLVGDSSSLWRISRLLQPLDLSTAREYRSSFDRAPFFADTRYQLALGGVESFRSRNGILATGAADVRNRSASGGLDLPLGLRLRGLYQEVQSVNWVHRGDGQGELRQSSREWPSGSLAWLYSPRWALGKVISTVASQTRYRRSVSTTVQPALGSATARTENRSTSLNPSLTLTWAGGVLTTAQLGRTRIEEVTSGNITRTNRKDIGGNLSFAFRAPAALVRLRNPLRSSLAVTVSDILVCLVRANSQECVPVSDSRRRQADFRLDTGFSPSITGGASFGYVLTEQRHTATKLSQANFTVFAEINFSAGQMR
ncbi:MAG: cell surface protein SprA [Gemmatimonadetes bacterium]|nr:cell surface protein SprA [Gemmatimonadota bacterium]